MRGKVPSALRSAIRAGGFPEEYQDSLFLPYFSTRREGTGLGLAIVRQIVMDHHGSVRAAPNVPAWHQDNHKFAAMTKLT